MAEIKVQIKGDDSDFKRKLEESSMEAREFGVQVKESMAQAKEAATDIMSDAGFGGITKMFGPAEIAAGTFGASLVDAFKEATTAATKYEESVTHLSLALGPARAGMAKDLQDWVESVSGAMGTVEENMAVFRGLTAIKGMGLEEAKNMLIEIQNAAYQMGASVGSLGEKIIELRSLGEIPKGFFREFPQIGEMVRRRLGPGAGAPGTAAEEESLAARVQKAGGADWLLKNILPAISPGGMQAPARIAAEGTAAGQLRDLGVQIENVSQEFGLQMLPTLKDFTKAIKGELPDITENLKKFGENLRGFLDMIGKLHAPLDFVNRAMYEISPMARMVGIKAPEGAYDFWGRFSNVFNLSANDLRDAAREHKEAAEALHRAVNPQ